MKSATWLIAIIGSGIVIQQFQISRLQSRLSTEHKTVMRQAWVQLKGQSRLVSHHEWSQSTHTAIRLVGIEESTEGSIVNIEIANDSHAILNGILITLATNSPRNPKLTSPNTYDEATYRLMYQSGVKINPMETAAFALELYDVPLADLENLWASAGPATIDYAESSSPSIFLDRPNIIPVKSRR